MISLESYNGNSFFLRLMNRGSSSDEISDIDDERSDIEEEEGSFFIGVIDRAFDGVFIEEIDPPISLKSMNLDESSSEDELRTCVEKKKVLLLILSIVLLSIHCRMN